MSKATHCTTSYLCVSGTRNSGPETLESARELAEGLGGTFVHWNVEPVHQEYIKLAESAIGRNLTWEQDDLTLQNIQARLRSPGIWMLANINRALLSTAATVVKLPWDMQPWTEILQEELPL
ncbi:MAG: hypothetical protein R3B93_21150 [Bacteroidia bacterium]